MSRSKCTHPLRSSDSSVNRLSTSATGSSKKSNYSILFMPTEYLFANAMTASPRGTSGSMQISDSNDRPRRRPSDAGQTYAQRSSSTASTSSSLHFNYVCRSHACHSAYRCLRHRVVPNLLPRVHGTSFRPLRERRNRRANESSACSFVTKARLYHPVKKIRVTDCCLGSVAPPQDSSECFVPA